MADDDQGQDVQEFEDEVPALEDEDLLGEPDGVAIEATREDVDEDEDVAYNDGVDLTAESNQDISRPPSGIVPDHVED